MTLVLASASPRRRVLLAELGLPFDVVPSGAEEPSAPRGTDAREYALALARRKAEEVARRYPDSIVLAADTVVAVDDTILGKPVDDADAFRMLSLLRGRRHLVVTGVVVICAGSHHQEAAAARVHMRTASDDELWSYVRSGEPMDKAGAYAVQGLGGRLVDEVDGCFRAVVGLPLHATARLLRTCGLSPADPPPSSSIGI